MKRSSFAALFLILICFLGACTKKKLKGEIVEPGPYFPAYPGSYWEYSNGLKLSVANEYKDFDDEMALPYINSEYSSEWSGYINGYSKTYDGKNFTPFLAETKTTIYGPTVFQGGAQFWKILSTDTSITIGNYSFNNVIAVAYGSGHTPPGVWYDIYFYAKDIGLVRKDEVFWSFVTSVGFVLDSTREKFHLTYAHIQWPK